MREEIRAQLLKESSSSSVSGVDEAEEAEGSEVPEASDTEVPTGNAGALSPVEPATVDVPVEPAGVSTNVVEPALPSLRDEFAGLRDSLRGYAAPATDEPEPRSPPADCTL